MTLELLSFYFSKYGVCFVFIIVLLEYMNLPGLPAGIIMPFVGVWSSGNFYHYVSACLVSVVAGTLASMIMYGIGRFFGQTLLKKYMIWFPKQRRTIEGVLSRLHRQGAKGIFLSKLIPMVRTLVGIPAGAIKMNVRSYLIASFFGVCIWNFVLISAGYMIGEPLLNLFM